jgi:hypothetical protein
MVLPVHPLLKGVLLKGVPLLASAAALVAGDEDEAGVVVERRRRNFVYMGDSDTRVSFYRLYIKIDGWTKGKRGDNFV